MRNIIIAVCAVVLSACGTISAQDYTDAKMEAAIANARIEAAMEARNQDALREELLRESIRQMLEEYQYLDGRRPHRPLKGGA